MTRLGSLGILLMLFAVIGVRAYSARLAGGDEYLWPKAVGLTALALFLWLPMWRQAGRPEKGKVCQ
jgi:hypothetical protein